MASTRSSKRAIEVVDLGPWMGGTRLVLIAGCPYVLIHLAETGGYRVVRYEPGLNPAEPQPVVYDLPPKRDHCECRGFLSHRRCKHVATLQTVEVLEWIHRGGRRAKHPVVVEMVSAAQEST